MAADMFNGPCGMQNKWTFIAVTYDALSHKVGFFCDNKFPVPAQIFSTLPGTTPELQLGYQALTESFAIADFACTSVYTSALATVDLWRAKWHCLTFQGPPNCPIACANGGSCIGPSLCICPPGFKGRLCGITEWQANFTLSKILTETPSVLSYWPLTAEYLADDIAPTNPVHGVSSTFPPPLAIGPYFLGERSFYTNGTADQLTFFESPFIEFNDTSFTLAFWMMVQTTSGASPIVEFGDETNRGPFISKHSAYSSHEFGNGAWSSSVITCSSYSQWAYVAFVYDQVSGKIRQFCNNATVIEIPKGGPVMTSKRLNLAHSPSTNAVGSHYIACMSLYSTALSDTELLLAKDHCSTFQVLCFPSCINGGTCVGSDWCLCPPGYTGPTCDISLCSPPCGVGGTCNGATSLCNCGSDWTGPTCMNVVSNYSGNFQQLRTPLPIALYFPLNEAYGTFEVTVGSLTGINALNMPAPGPNGVTGGGIENWDGVGSELSYDSTDFSMGTSSFTIALWYSSNGYYNTATAYIFEYVDNAGQPLTYLAQSPDSNSLTALFHGSGATLTLTGCQLHQWTYVALSYDWFTQQGSIYCDTGSSTHSASTAALASEPGTSTKFILSAHMSGSVAVRYKSQMACLSVFRPGLDQAQLYSAKQLCQFYSTPNLCPVNCAPGGCRSSPAGTTACATCVIGWAGPLCDIPLCNPTCANGICTSPNVCDCSPGYTGLDCSEPICSVPCPGGGSCVAPDTCQCPAGWQGALCDAPVCNVACQNGASCVQPDRCDCQPGWTGRSCGTTITQHNYNVAQLNKIPGLLSYWPMAADYAMDDVEPNGPINGVTSIFTKTYGAGPFGGTNKAFLSGWTAAGQTQFSTMTSNQLSLSNSSLTIALWVWHGISGWTPYFEYYYNSSSGIGLHLWQDNLNNLHVNPLTGVSNTSLFSSPCAMINQWQFVGAVYDVNSGLMTAFCDNSFHNLPFPTNMPSTRDRFLIGARLATPTFNTIGSFACVSIHTRALTLTEMQTLKGQCQLFAPTCTPSCPLNNAICHTNNTCICLSGWTGANCDVPVCSNGCFSGTCSAPETCSCLPGWTGLVCGTSLIAEQYGISRIATEVAGLIDFFPLSMDYGLKALNFSVPNVGTSSTNSVMFSPGPFGKLGTSFQTSRSLGRYIIIENSRYNYGNTSFTFAVWTKIENPDFAPLVVWRGIASLCLDMSQFPVANSLIVTTRLVNNLAGLINKTCPMFNQWQFVGATFDAPTQQLSFFCDHDFVGNYTSPGGAKTSNRTCIGARQETSTFTDGSFACASFYDKSMTIYEIRLIKDHCKLFSVQCDETCQNGGNCAGFNICQCPPLWTGPLCDVSICGCGFGSVCQANGSCICAQGWTGPKCLTAVGNFTANFLALKAALPPAVALWPLGTPFWHKDASGNLRHAVSGASLSNLTGPARDIWNSTTSVQFASVNTPDSLVFDNPSFATENSSWTFSIFVTTMDQSNSVTAILQYVTSTDGLLSWISIAPDQKSLTAAPGLTGAPVTIGGKCGNFTSTWIYVSFVYDATTKRFTLFCDDFVTTERMSSPVLSVAPETSNRFYLARTVNPTPATNMLRLACASFYKTALSYEQIYLAKQQCQFYPRLCVSKCHLLGCNAWANNTFTCSQCIDGWSGDLCDIAVCNAPCLNGGNCTSPDRCTCPPGWTGRRCGLPSSQIDVIASKFATETPSLLSYWPLTGDYSGDDAAAVNPIDGKETRFAKLYPSGPYGGNGGAFSTANGTNYFELQSALLNLAPNSFSIGVWVFVESSDDTPLFEWISTAASPPWPTHLWQFQSQLYSGQGTGAGTLQASCLMQQRWQFVGLRFNSLDSTIKLFCDSDLLPIQSTGSVPVTTTRLAIGARPLYSPSFARASFACVSVYASALSRTEFLTAKDHCKLFHVHCSQPCLNNGTCIGFNLCSCPNGWMGPRCELNSCRCGHGSTCLTNGSCLCAPGWTGPQCLRVVGDPIVALQTVKTTLPSPVAVWPLSDLFGANDASGNLYHGTRGSNVNLGLLGPGTSQWGIVYGLETSATPGTGHLTFANAAFAFGSGSWSFAFFVNTAGYSNAHATFFQFIDATNNPQLSMNQSPDPTTLQVLPEPSGMPVAIPEKCVLSSWSYVAVVYDSAAMTLTIFCDDFNTIHWSSSITLTAAPVTTNTFVMGYSSFPAAGFQIQFACASLYPSALNLDKLYVAKQQCQLYNNVCPANCQTASCYALADNTFGCTACVAGWQGVYCDQAVCTNPCLNGGSCVLPDVCNCTSQWTGTVCDVPICEPGCVQGTCTAPNICTCNAGWTGPLCDLGICSDPCQNGGNCTAPEVCTCPAGRWTGPTCTVAICSQLCANGGSCTAPDTCTCTPGWTGFDCSTFICSPSCNPIGGNCTGPNQCSCKVGWEGTLCQNAICSQACLNGGACTAPDYCTCVVGWTGPLCENTTAVIAPAAVAAMTGAQVVQNVEVVTTAIVNLAAEATRNVSTGQMIDMIATMSQVIAKISNGDVNATMPPAKLKEFVTHISKAVDAMMTAAVNVTIIVEEEQEKGDRTSSMRCDRDAASKGFISGKIDVTATGDQSDLNIPDRAELQRLYASFLKMIIEMLGSLRTSLEPGTSSNYNGKFFAATVFNLRFGDLPGLKLQTSLASCEFPSVNNPFHLIGSLPDKCKGLTKDSVVPFILSAFIVNVLDVDQPFNMPTITTRLYCDKQGVEVAMNKSHPVTIRAIPTVRKANLFKTEKVEVQCDVSRVSCDLSENANRLGSLVTFPLVEKAGDFVLIFPREDFAFTTFISLNSTPSISNYHWQSSVSRDASNVTLTATPNATDLEMPRWNFNSQSGELRFIISGKALERFFQGRSGQSRRLYVYMKRDLSKYSLENMPEAACQMQRCFGYHLRLGPASSGTIISKRKRSLSSDSTYDEGFELEPESSESEVVFKSSYFGDFGADLVITPNTIEFSEIFDNFAQLVSENAAVLAFQCVAITFFLIGLCFAYKFDREDLKEWAFLPIKSNKRYMKNRYLVSVQYGSVKNFKESPPKVYIRLDGNANDTAWRLLDDGVRPNFNGKHPENFLLNTQVYLGRLEALDLLVESGGHENFQLHIDRIVVVDVAKGFKYIFLVKSTLKTGDQAHVEVASEDELKGYTYLISGHSKTGFTEIHPWISIAQRPLPSNWTRVERLACVVSALFMAMLVNAMFYGKETKAPKVGLSVGGIFTISWFTLWTSFIGCVIVIPPTAIIAIIFKKVQRASAEKSHWMTVFNLKKQIPKPVEQSADAKGGSKKKVKEPFKLPYKCVIIAWLLVAAAIGTSSFMVIMYSLSWGKEKSLAWLSGMFMSVFQDILLIQPVKTILSAIFSATVHSLPSDGMDLGKLTYNERNDRQKVVLFYRLRGVLTGIFHHAIYVVVFAVVIATTTNPYAYQQIGQLKPLYALDNVAQVRGAIVDYSQIFDYLETKLLPTLLNGNQLEYGGYFLTPGDLYSNRNPNVALLGPIRIRQQRVSQNRCPLGMDVAFKIYKRFDEALSTFGNLSNCQNEYSNALGASDSGEKRSFNGSWSLLWDDYYAKDNLSITALPWIFREDASVYSGWEASYPGGGYYVDLPRKTPAQAQGFVRKVLREKRWLDNATNVVLIDFNLFNAQTNLFIPVKIVFEALSAGGMSYHLRMFPLQLYQYSGASSMLIFIVQALWILILFSHAFKIGRQIKKEGWRMFRKNGWNLLDLVQILWGFGVVGLFAARIYVIMQVVSKIQTTKSTYVSLDLLSNWEDILFGLFGIQFFMAMFLFFRHLSVNKHWAVLLATLSKGKLDLASYGTIFGMVTFFFAGVAYLIMGNQSQAFSTFARALMTLIQAIIGTIDFTAVNMKFYLVICMAYNAIVIFIGGNIFVTLIMAAYADVVSGDVETETSYDADLARFIATGVKEILARTPNKTVVIKNRRKDSDNDDNDDNEAATSSGSNIDATLARLEKIVGRAVDSETGREFNKSLRGKLSWTADTIEYFHQRQLWQQVIENKVPLQFAEKLLGPGASSMIRDAYSSTEPRNRRESGHQLEPVSTWD